MSGRALDEDANVLLRFNNGAKGVLHSSQISVGEENNLNIRIWGERAGLEWHQTEPNTLVFKPADGPTPILRTNTAHVHPVSTAHSRIPAGHPEGYLEGFANISRNFVNDLRRRAGDSGIPENLYQYPTVHDGVRGMAFIDAVVQSSKTNAAWTSLATSD